MRNICLFSNRFNQGIIWTHMEIEHEPRRRYLRTMAREKSPLPGWDPYLQRFWRDVHHRLITYSSDFLHRVLPSDLRVRIEERVVLEAGDPVLSRDIYVPDVAVFDRSNS